MARREQKPTEQLNLKPGEQCMACAFIRVGKGRLAVVPDTLKSAMMYPCLRYPQPVLKELGDWCGEFKAR